MSPASERTPIPLVLASLLLIPAASFGFIRLFADQAAVLPIVVAGFISGCLAVVTRHARISIPGSLAISIVALAVLIELRFAPGTQRLGVVPTRLTIDTLTLLYDIGIQEFQTEKAPVDRLDSFIAASMIAAWLLAFLTDWGALRLRLAFEPVLPGALLFFFASILGSGTYVVRTTLVFALAVAVWSVTQRASNLAIRQVWLLADAKRGPRGIARSAATMLAMAVALGVTVGPSLPGAESEELYYWREKPDPTRTVVSPFVSIRDQLANQTDQLLFTVVADEPAYWRVVGLDSFDEDKDIWKLDATFKSESGTLPQLTATPAQQRRNTQYYQIESLSSIWLPAAYSPTEIISSDSPARWHAATSSLTISDDRKTSDGMRYTIESAVSNFDPATLNAASDTIPQDIRQQYLAVPSSISPVVATEAQKITSGASTRYEQMLALQAYFREFDYSIRLGPRDDDAFAQFLDERVGFCQQFSGTFAMMARTLGAPARVAVGFTWGDRTEIKNQYAVTGRNAHAWPEVYFEGIGWVPFEPTPGRGAPNGGHTGVAESQDSDDVFQEDSPTTTLAPTAPEPSVVAPAIPGFDDPGTTSPAEDAEDGLRFPKRVAALVGIVGVYAFGAPLLRSRLRQRERRQAVEVADRIEVAWKQAMPQLQLAYGLQRDTAETRSEFATRAGKRTIVPSEAIDDLAQAATLARFSPPGLAEEHGLSATAAYDTITTTVNRHVPQWKRWLNQLDPRTMRR